MRTKKFKTVAGYLRHMDSQLSYREATAELKHRPYSIADDQREAINNLLRQHGIGLIAAHEKPSDGVVRLQQLTEDGEKKKTLAACLKWLEAPRLVLSPCK